MGTTVPSRQQELVFKERFVLQADVAVPNMQREAMYSVRIHETHLEVITPAGQVLATATEDELDNAIALMDHMNGRTAASELHA